MAENKKNYKKTKSQKEENIYSTHDFHEFCDDENFSSVGNEFPATEFHVGNDFPAAVIDASYFASAVLVGEGEKSVEAQNFIQSLIERNGQLFVPELFWFEIGNVLLGASTSRKDGSPARITKKQLNDIFLLLSDLPFSTDVHPSPEIRLRILMLAQQENLTYYDAAYLELAERYDIALKTWDASLQAAAEKD